MYCCVIVSLLELVQCLLCVVDMADRSVHPYCAVSQQAFLDWRVGKRRAAEVYLHYMRYALMKAQTESLEAVQKCTIHIVHNLTH